MYKFTVEQVEAANKKMMERSQTGVNPKCNLVFTEEQFNNAYRKAKISAEQKRKNAKV